MKMKLICCILLFLNRTELKAQESSLFWEIKKVGYSTSYLYGTIHIQDQRVFQFNDSLLPLLKSCGAFAGEIIFEPENIFELLPYFFEKDLKKQCQNLLSKKEYKQVSKYIEKNHGDEFLTIMPFMSPYMLSILLSSKVAASDTSQELILDQYFQVIADSLGMDLISLESMEEQFSYIQNIDGKAQTAYLMKSLKKSRKAEMALEDIIEAYLFEDLDRIQELIAESSQEDPLITEDFIINRNLIQFEGMLEAMALKSTFTAVGAAHLPGEQGLINILRAAGFVLRPIYKK